MSKVTFKCIRSGNTVSFTNKNDIDGMRKHEGFLELKIEEAKEPEKETPIPKPRGRPKLGVR